MMSQVPSFPEGEQLPTYGDMADLLVQALPEADRAEAHKIVAEQILPLILTGLADHPNPRRLAEVVYEELAEELAQSEPDQRLAVLQTAAGRAEIREQVSSSLSIAIARYLKENPTKTEAVSEWLDPAIQRWQAISVSDLQAEATQRLEKLEKWQNWAKTTHPDVWNAYRLNFIHSKLNLQSARSGSFKTATGSLYDFLVEAGAPVENLDIH